MLRVDVELREERRGHGKFPVAEAPWALEGSLLAVTLALCFVEPHRAPHMLLSGALPVCLLGFARQRRPRALQFAGWLAPVFFLEEVPRVRARGNVPLHRFHGFVQCSKPAPADEVLLIGAVAGAIREWATVQPEDVLKRLLQGAGPLQLR